MAAKRVMIVAPAASSSWLVVSRYIACEVPGADDGGSFFVGTQAGFTNRIYRALTMVCLLVV